MATRVCPQCGSQYVASVRRCIDCDLVLVEEVGVDGEAAASATSSPVGDGDTIAYELEGWGSQLKVTLEGMLDREGVRRVWEAGALVVAAEFEEQVDALIATVEGGEGLELADDAEQIAFEIEGLTAEELTELDARLIAEHVAHAWEEGGALLVGVDDEERVAELIDDVLNPDDEDDGDVDGLATTAALSDLFVAVDKLMKDATDAKLIGRFTAAATAIEGLGVPYGLSGADWDDLQREVGELQRLVAPGGPARADADDDDDPPSEDGLDEEADGDEAGGEQADDDGGAQGGDDLGEDVEVDAEGEVALTPRERAEALARGLRARLAELV